MLGIGRKPLPNRPLVTRHTVVIRVAGLDSACMTFLQQVFRLVAATFDCRIRYERYDGDVVVTSPDQEVARIE